MVVELSTYAFETLCHDGGQVLSRATRAGSLPLLALAPASPRPAPAFLARLANASALARELDPAWLYRAGSFARIAMESHVRTLCGQLIGAYKVRGQNIEVAIRVGDIQLEIEQAVSCGLVINELVTNAFKHAFPGGRAGTVGIEMERLDGSRCRLRVRDDGVGLPPELSLDGLESMGLQLVQDLVGQLHGEIAVGRDGGMTFDVSFAATGA